MHRHSRATLRAAWWALLSLRRTRRALRRGGLDRFELASPPLLPRAATRGVEMVLRRVPQTCLERALVLQRWYADQGEPRDVVIAVRGSARSLKAHAWLEGEPPASGYEELMRVPAT